MKKIFPLVIALILVFFLVACSGVSNSNVPEIPTTVEVYQMFVNAGLPVGNYIDYTEETDPNTLMNKSNQYTAKLDFAITTLNQSDPDSPTGGSVEIFKTNADAKARKDYIDGIGKSMPALIESSEIVRDVILVRIDRGITATEAQKYFDAARTGQATVSTASDNSTSPIPTNENTPSSSISPAPSASINVSTASEYYFQDNILQAKDVRIEITDVKIQKENYSNTDVIAFWYTITNLKDDDTVTPLDWIFYFEAIQDNDPNIINTLKIASLPDDQFLDSQMARIKPGGSVPCAVAYILSDLKTPVTLKATQGLFEELGTQEFLLEVLLQNGSSSEQTFKTEDYARISFSIESSWDKRLNDDGRMIYYPAVEEPTGFIQCTFAGISIGSVSEQEAKTLLDNGIDGAMGTSDNPVEINRTHYKAGNHYAARASYYFDFSNNDINDDALGVIDSVVVLFDDGIALLTAIFTQSEYDETYRDIIETTLTSVQVNKIEQTSESKVEWADFLKEYEAWVDEYIAFMEKYKANPTDLSLMADYIDMMSKMAEWAEKAEDIEDELSGDDLRVYMDTMTRILQKLASAAL